MSETPESAAKAATGGGRWRLVALVVIVVGLFAAGRWLPLEEWVGGLRGHIADLGPWGPVAYIAVYILWTVGALPGVPISVMAAPLFGGLWGTVLVSIASTLGAASAFVIARYVARSTVRRWIAGNRRFEALDRMTAERGAFIVALTRLVPLFPFNLLNYGFGLTRVRFWTYVLWSWLGMLPGTVMYVVGADAILRGITEGRVPWVTVAVVVAVGVLLFFLGRRARRALAAVSDEAGVELPEEVEET